MDGLSLTDLSRMLHAIQHECSIRIREIKLEASQEYNLIKGEIITAKEKQLSSDFAKKIKELEKEREREESNIKQQFKLKVNGLKADIIATLMDDLKIAVEKKEMSPFLINQIADRITEDNYYVFCFKKDCKKIQAVFDSKKLKYEIRELPAEALGGIIVCSRDGKEIWDNTFETRINDLFEKNLDRINKEIFLS